MAEKVAVTGRVELVIHQVGAEETTRHRRSRTGKSNQRGASPNREVREGRVVRRMALFRSLAGSISHREARGVCLNHR